MTWSHLLFAHWPCEPAAVAAHLPASLKLDTRDGEAWVGVVPFLMSDIAPRACPAIPGANRFLELNLRTYVTRGGKPGVWFFSLDAAHRLAVRAARTFFHLPYMDAEMQMDEEPSNRIRYRSHRTHRGEPPAEFEAEYWGQGEFKPAAVGSLEHWLTARYCLYSADRRGRVFRGEIDHPPWQLASADWTVRQNSLATPFGLDLSAAPHLLLAAPVTVRAWLALPVRP